MKCSSLNYKSMMIVTYVLIIIGALNWGLVGLFEFDLVAQVFGYNSFMSKLVYDLVAISAIINVTLELAVCKSPSKCYT